jgi:AraC family transcriptional regulator of adaptative response/methylated-DNA-[protein]-cysteine methyltransferase
LGDDAEALVERLQERFDRAELVGGDAGFERTVARVVGLVDGKRGGRSGLGLPLDLRGTAFQRRVWEALLAIPRGETRSYAEVATAVGAKGSERAVGAACGANHLAVVIPCHRVVRRDGGMGGYRWGVERKERLLARERCG